MVQVSAGSRLSTHAAGELLGVSSLPITMYMIPRAVTVPMAAVVRYCLSGHMLGTFEVAHPNHVDTHLCFLLLAG